MFQEDTAEPVAVGTTGASIESLETDKETDPFKKYQDIRHQDFGEIVFRKQKRSKKKANKGMVFTKKIKFRLSTDLRKYN